MYLIVYLSGAGLFLGVWVTVGGVGLGECGWEVAGLSYLLGQIYAAKIDGACNVVVWMVLRVVRV